MHSEAECRHAMTLAAFLWILLSCLALSQCAGTVEARHTVESPDANVVVTFDVADEQGSLIYSVAFDDRPVIVNSRLELALKDAASLETGFEISKVSASSHDSTYSPVYSR